jgi:competence protein ComEC
LLPDRARLTALWWAKIDAERHALPLWLPVAFASGVAAWFLVPWAGQRAALAVLLAGLGMAALLLRWRPLAVLAWLALAGMGAAQWRSSSVAHPVLAARTILRFEALVTAVEIRSDRDRVRLLLAPAKPMAAPATDEAASLPPLVRVSLRGGVPPGVAPGARVALRAMLAPPAGAAVPGGYDFARRAWFAGIGATGFALGPVQVLAPAPPPSGALAWLAAVRAGLQARITTALPGPEGAIAAAFVTGDQGAIPLDTAQAMRDSGLAHLLSISGVHIAVVVGGTIFLVRRLLALFPFVALRWPVRTIAVAAAALVGIAYSLLAGAEVPTVRTILATLIVLIGMVIGREALSLRLLATAAILILAFRPEALLGPSFQLSFAAVVAIVALYESRLGRWLTTAGEDERLVGRLGRHLASLLVSGLVAELALSSIGLFHFNRAGLYGIFANLLAIPWSSFVVMPLLVVALVAEGLGLGALAWPAVGWAMGLLLALAERTAVLPGSVLRLPTMPMAAYALIVAGGLWLALWRTGWRWWGAGAVGIGLAWALAVPPPDLLVSADGHGAALRLGDGRLALLRPRTGSFLRSNWADAVVGTGEAALADVPGAACSRDACVAVIDRGGRRWRLLATLSRDFIARDVMEPACAAADIVISERRLPGWCRPRWIRLDRQWLGEAGSTAVWLGSGRIATANRGLGDHPWRPAVPVRQRRSPASMPGGSKQALHRVAIAKAPSR